MATIYVIHFERPFQGKTHYIGFTRGDVFARGDRHQAGTGSAFMRAVTAARIRWIIVKTYRVADPERAEVLEQQMKQSGHSERFCPVCSPHRFAFGPGKKVKESA